MVTGASGYIGSHIVANLLSKGRRVRATVRDSSDPERVGHLESLSVPDGGYPVSYTHLTLPTTPYV